MKKKKVKKKKAVFKILLTPEERIMMFALRRAIEEAQHASLDVVCPCCKTVLNGEKAE